MRRLIVCLDVRGGRVVKGVRFEGLKDMGDPVELASRYEQEGADEICFLDISASEEERNTLLAVVEKAAQRLFIPLTVGGGVRSSDDMARVLRAGADKVSLNSSAVRRPKLLTECSERFGSQCVVASIDARKEGDGYRVYTHGGKTPTDLSPLPWAQECTRLGAGEILLTSIDRDGVRGGYDTELTAQVARAVSVPVIASGGAGAKEHIAQAFSDGLADAALVAGILHERVTTVSALKRHMVEQGIPTRDASSSLVVLGSGAHS